MSAVFYLQSSPEEIRWCSCFELYWFCCKFSADGLCSSWIPAKFCPPPPELLRRQHAAGFLGARRRPAVLQPHLLKPELVREHLLDEVDEALGAGVAHDALQLSTSGSIL